jgi:hypothetical protein
MQSEDRHSAPLALPSLLVNSLLTRLVAVTSLISIESYRLSRVRYVLRIRAKTTYNLARKSIV